MKILSIIVPVYNEEKTILKILKKINKVNLNKLNLKKEIIVVDDGSNDNTPSLLKKNKELYDKLLTKRNEGKGSAIKRGLKEAKGDIILIQDADLEYNPNQIPKLVRPIINNETMVVYGSRFLRKKYHIFGKTRTIIPLHLIGNILLSIITKILYFSDITDMETCYKIFRREVIMNMKLKSKKFDFEPEITAKILKRGYEIVELPIKFNARDFDAGKKITWKDGLYAVMYLLIYRFVD